MLFGAVFCIQFMASAEWTLLIFVSFCYLEQKQSSRLSADYASCRPRFRLSLMRRFGLSLDADDVEATYDGSMTCFAVDIANFVAMEFRPFIV